MIETVTDAAFAERVLQAPRPVLVEFTASWCPSCRMVAPVLAELAGELAGRMDVVAIDVDANPQAPMAAGIMGMPTMALYSGGEIVARIVGARPKAALREAFESHLPVDNSAEAVS